MVLKCGAKIQSSHISAIYLHNNSLWDKHLVAHIGDTLYHGSCNTFNNTWKKSATMSQFADCGAAVPEW
jgi:hypothetical protein